MIQTAQFDPTSDLFVAQFARPPGLQAVNMRALSPMQRALLVIDGTVTKLFEAITLEPVDVVRLGQAEQTLVSDNQWLEAPSGTKVIARHVYLRGEYGNTVHAYATSLIVPDRFPRHVLDGLDVDGGSLGRILLSSEMENRREILWFGRETNVVLPDEVGQIVEGEFITRSYRVIVEGRPIMLINERFPSHNEYMLTHD